MLLILFFAFNPLIVLVIAYGSGGSIIVRPDIGFCSSESIGPSEMMHGHFESHDYQVDFYIVLQDFYEMNSTLSRPDFFILHESGKQAEIFIEPVNERRPIYILFLSQMEQRVEYQFYFETPEQNFSRIAAPFLSYFSLLLILVIVVFVISKYRTKQKTASAPLEHPK
jgi:hypothetical protein